MSVWMEKVEYDVQMYGGNPKGDQYGWKMTIRGRSLKELRRHLALHELVQKKEAKP